MLPNIFDKQNTSSNFNDTFKYIDMRNKRNSIMNGKEPDFQATITSNKSKKAFGDRSNSQQPAGSLVKGVTFYKNAENKDSDGQ